MRASIALWLSAVRRSFTGGRRSRREDRALSRLVHTFAGTELVRLGLHTVVRNGVVTLHGSPGSDLRKLEALIRSVPGVRAVNVRTSRPTPE